VSFAFSLRLFLGSPKSQVRNGVIVKKTGERLIVNQAVEIQIDRTDEDIRLFKSYLYQSKILIVDPHKPSGKRLLEILLELGAQADKIYGVDNFQDAMHVMEDIKPDVLFSEYYLQGEDVFLLFKHFKKIRPDQNRCLTILITSNNNQSYVALAAEEEIDVFLIKPYNSDFLKQMLFENSLFKINPSEYLKMVEMGKKLILEGKLAEAKDLLVEAQKIVPDPTLAYYYLGQIDLLNDAKDNAKEKFLSGLAIHEVHFKSLDGLFNRLIEENEIKQAYEVVKKMMRFFPFNSERLTKVLKLAVVTENYLDIEDYYKVYQDSSITDNTLKKYICASLITMGKYYLNEKDLLSANKAFQRSASILSTGVFLRNCIESLCDHQMLNEAKYFLQLFSIDERETEHYKVSSFLVNALSGNSYESIIEEGKHLVYGDMVNSKIVFKFLYYYLAKTGDHVAIENLLKKKAEVLS